MHDSVVDPGDAGPAQRPRVVVERMKEPRVVLESGPDDVGDPVRAPQIDSGGQPVDRRGGVAWSRGAMLHQRLRGC